MGVHKNKDIFLSEVQGGGQVGVEKLKMDVYFNQFWCAQLGSTRRLKEKLNFSKNLLKSTIYSSAFPRSARADELASLARTRCGNACE